MPCQYIFHSIRNSGNKIYVFLREHICIGMKLKPNEKICLSCRGKFPIERFYTYTRKKDGYIFYSPRCKECENLLHRKRFDISPEKRATILFHSAKTHSKERKCPFSITKEDIIAQYKTQNGKCYYSGIPMSSLSKTHTKMSLDRKNSALGYTKENIVLCCWQVNNMKKNYSEIDFLQVCKSIYDFSMNRVF